MRMERRGRRELLKRGSRGALTLLVGAMVLQFVAAGAAGRPSAGFVHPGVLVTRPMLEAMRADVRARREPTYSAFLEASTGTIMPNACNDTRICNVTLGSLAYVPHPTAVVPDNSVAAWPEKEDAAAAYTHALLWFITEARQI